MPEAIKEPDVKIRLSLDLNPEMKAILEGLAAKVGGSQSEVLRRAIALLKTIKDAEAQGETPALIKDGKIIAKIVGA